MRARLPVVATCAALLGTGTLPAAESRGCLLHAWIADSDPDGTNLRAGPSSAAAVVTRLPHSRAEGGDSFAPELEVIGFANGWAKVRRVRFAGYGEREIMLFAGIGWISGRLLSASLMHMPLPAIPADGWAGAPRAEPDGVVLEAIDDCRGAFAHVTARLADGRRVTGWTTDLCANQATTCS